MKICNLIWGNGKIVEKGRQNVHLTIIMEKVSQIRDIRHIARRSMYFGTKNEFMALGRGPVKNGPSAPVKIKSTYKMVGMYKSLLKNVRPC